MTINIKTSPITYILKLLTLITCSGVKLYSFDPVLFTARKLKNEGNYPQAIQEYGKSIELLFKELYKEYLLQLSYTDKEKAINYEKKVDKPIDKFTIGQWLGLFREAHFFDVIMKKRRIEKNKCVFFTHAIIDAILKLRNRSTHLEEDLDIYCNKHVAAFVESAVVCVLQELGMISKNVEYPTNKEIESVYQGKKFAEVSRRDILRAAKDPRIKEFHWRTKYVEIEGKKYPLKGLLSIASGVHTSQFVTTTAQRVLTNLGFKIISTGDYR